MGSASKEVIRPIRLAILVLSAAPWLCAQKALTLPELGTQRTTLDGKTVRLRGILSASHIGPLLKDESGQVAVRLRFEGLPRPARKQVVRDDLYRKLFELTNSIPDPNQPKLQYEVELLGLVRTLKKPKYDVYKESPIEICPLRVFRVITLPAGGRSGAKIPNQRRRKRPAGGYIRQSGTGGGQ